MAKTTTAILLLVLVLVYTVLQVASSEDQIPAAAVNGLVATLGSLLQGKPVSMDALTQLVATFNTLLEGN
jgi:hypothetical protein